MYSAYLFSLLKLVSNISINGCNDESIICGIVERREGREEEEKKKRGQQSKSKSKTIY